MDGTLGQVVSGRDLGSSSGSKHIWLACIECGTERWVYFTPSRPPAQRCLKCGWKNPGAREKQGNYLRQRTGDKNSNWKGGRTQLVRAIKNSYEYKNWRKRIFERDNYSCTICGDRGGIEIVPDHIIPFSAILNEYKIDSVQKALSCSRLWDISNGRTLCHPCHRETPTYGWKLYNAK